jgi:hypothetical protein
VFRLCLPEFDQYRAIYGSWSFEWQSKPQNNYVKVLMVQPQYLSCLTLLTLRTFSSRQK